MKVLWLCNTVPPEVCDVFGFRKRYHEGWITGMLDEIKKHRDIELGLCLPIRNPERMKDGNAGIFCYYSFPSFGFDVISDEATNRLSEIIKAFQPDVIHIWGAEYGQSLAMVKACEVAGTINRLLVHIQGIASAILPYYAVSIPEIWMKHASKKGSTIEDDRKQFCRRGDNEQETLKRIRYAAGRTDWDRSYINAFYPNINYRNCGEILRKKFYYSSRKWQYEACQPHSLFITQGGYPIKGIHLIIPGIALLKRKYPDIVLNITGDTTLINGNEGEIDPYDEYLQYLMEEYNVTDNIRFWGPLATNEMLDMYLGSKVCVSSSTIENSSNSIGEAQLLGVPVIATYTGGTPSLVEHGKTGLLYQMDAPYMFAACVERIFEDEVFATYLSENEREVAFSRYDPQTVSSQLISIYNEISTNAEND